MLVHHVIGVTGDRLTWKPSRAIKVVPFAAKGNPPHAEVDINT